MTPARERLVVLGVAAVLTALAVAAEQTTHVHNDHGQLYITFGLAVTWSFVVAGLVARHRRPENRTGLLMTGVGLAWVLNAFADAPIGAGVAIAVVSSSLWAAALLHLVLAYPSGRLTTRRTRLIVIAAYVDTAGVAVLLTPFTEPRLDGADRGTALNPLLISHQSGLVAAINGVSLAFGLALVAATVVVLIRRWRAATVTVRRELKPVYLTGVVALAALAVFALASQASAVRNSGAAVHRLLAGARRRTAGLPVRTSAHPDRPLIGRQRADRGGRAKRRAAPDAGGASAGAGRSHARPGLPL